ncbi:hypothetical protein [Flavisolibacter ginsenosidimutans]|uniref:Uncharacterized protein n=1 Tax=Flavisolibacter ginsenosidimutans TaxID=661481 RepID=A0A5B8UP12_9BACT|nr:hypothetical protein [Flavisolibacter ginsenosidimutans]QEC57969.1 hypothetical protein FSB75_19335 [Flavisolibacter ginsenosidimutans]
MLLDLYKTFCFSRDGDIYQVGYVFEKAVTENEGVPQTNICLTVTFSKNQSDNIIDKINKASSILSQSNESIESDIKMKVLSYN